jgi:acyl-CoA reductase-like NAD-dependent aldehyde dehydrogenase
VGVCLRRLPRGGSDLGYRQGGGKARPERGLGASGRLLRLTGAIWTNQLNTALKTAMRVKSGYVWVNGTSAHYMAMPFGGYRNSGTGREEGLEELLSYTRRNRSM